MPSMSWLIFTPEQNEQVLADSEETVFKIEPRIIDCDDVSTLADPILSVGMYVAPSRVLTGDEYGPVWGTSWVAALPVRTADPDVLFKPPEYRTSG